MVGLKEKPPIVRPGTLYPFQEEAVRRLGRRALLADDPGLGKTRTALAAACRWAAFPLLVVSPLSVLGFWEEETRNVLGISPVRIREAGDVWMALEAGMGLVNPERLRVVVEALGESRGFRGLILDEAHLYKNHQTRRNKHGWEYTTQRVEYAARLARRAEFVWLLTATPDPNGTPAELVPQLEMLGAMWLFGRRERLDFLERYGVLEVLEVAGRRIYRYTRWRRREEALKILEQNGYYLRREKREVARWLPEIIREVMPIPMEEEQWKAYREIRRQVVAMWERELADLPEAEQRAALSRKLLALSAVALGKMHQFTEWVKVQWVEEIAGVFPKPTVWFVVHPKHAREIARRLGGAALTGETPAEERSRMVQAFREGRLEHLAITIRAGGAGISLENAAGAVFLSMDWAPGANRQAEERVHRINRTAGPPLIWRVVASGPAGQPTVDRYIEKVLNQKGWTAQEAVLHIMENLRKEDGDE